jgi:tetratricopeptide (TPR) repeat protein
VPPTVGPPYTESITWFARALGAARIGDAAAGEKATTEIAARQKALVEAGNAYWAREVEVQQRAATAWTIFAQGRPEHALKLMRQAADLEDANEKHIVTPGRVLPARELLGDMLLEAGQPAAALREYETSQSREPNRFRGYYGVARAAEEAGDREKAANSYQQLLALANDGGSERPELARARAYIAR